MRTLKYPLKSYPLNGRNAKMGGIFTGLLKIKQIARKFPESMICCY